MIEILLVFIGGSIGAGLRYLISSLFSFSCWATLGINIVGCLFIGFVSYIALKDEDFFHPDFKLFLTTGVIGGFTTFSAFSYDIFNLVKTGHLAAAAVYIGLSYFLGLLAVLAGFMLAKTLVFQKVAEEFVEDDIEEQEENV